MPTLTIEYATDAERLQYEQAIAYAREMIRLGATADHGAVLDTGERFALDRGRAVLRDGPAAAVPARADAEQKPPGTGPRAARPGP